MIAAIRRPDLTQVKSRATAPGSLGLHKETSMYSQILVSTDGSKLSQKAIRTAVRLAKATGGAVTGAYVMAPYVPPAYGEGVMYATYVTPKRYKEACERAAKKALAAVEVEAQAAGVGCRKAMLTADNPWEGIIKAAKSKRCDLIVMASHGRRGLAGLVLGSETVKVLTHSKIPVLVCR
ncbi:MAG: universal stress protein [Betaproteobacteria bacterium]|nr:universal stress protein [Betaproteobacteria bacterium]